MNEKKAKLIRREVKKEKERLVRLKPWWVPMFIWKRIVSRIGLGFGGYGKY